MTDLQYEFCDDGDDVDENRCTNRCRFAACGDGIVRSDLTSDEVGFEACDDGNFEDNDACTNGCQNATRRRWHCPARC